jgi:hypothetical protein
MPGFGVEVTWGLPGSPPLPGSGSFGPRVCSPLPELPSPPPSIEHGLHGFGACPETVTQCLSPALHATSTKPLFADAAMSIDRIGIAETPITPARINPVAARTANAVLPAFVISTSDNRGEMPGALERQTTGSHPRNRHPIGGGGTQAPTQNHPEKFPTGTRQDG